jgi:hypothetical protein
VIKNRLFTSMSKCVPFPVRSTNLQHRLEEELDVKIYPGTEIMTDVGTHHFVKLSGTSSDVLVPQPSDNPQDPLVRALTTSF